MVDINQSVIDRFWKYVDKGDGNPYKCWEWIGTKNRGYGQLSSKRNQSPYKAHRLSVIIHYGYIPDGMCILHKCDNPSCVNPRHLFYGTQSDNMADAAKKKKLGRSLGSLLALHPGRKGYHGAGPKSNLELIKER